MKKIGLFYSFNTKNTSKIAEKIAKEFGEENIEKVNVEEVNDKKFLSFDNYILGVPTWFEGELPNYWDEFVPAIEDLDLTGKKVAIFGNGDQVNYPEFFVDAIGILGSLVEERGADLIGETSAKDYNFESSKALRKGKFMGLAIDTANQANKTDERIKNWVKELKKKFL